MAVQEFWTDDQVEQFDPIPDFTEMIDGVELGDLVDVEIKGVIFTGRITVINYEDFEIRVEDLKGKFATVHISKFMERIHRSSELVQPSEEDFTNS